MIIRRMEKSDAELILNQFKNQCWDKDINVLNNYFTEQEKGIRKVYIAVEESNDEILGYATLLDNDINGPYKNLDIPVVCDFNVFVSYQKMGVGSFIMQTIEDDVKKYSNKISLGVGLHSGYGSAQRMYVKRGYIPDGSGVWFHNEVLAQYANCVNDDDLVLYLMKEF